MRVVLEVALLVVVLLAAVSVLWDSARLGIGPVPTSPAVRATALTLVPQDAAGDWHELGAGFGGLAVAVARARPAVRVIAWEAALVPWLCLRARLAVLGPRNVVARRADFFAGALREAKGVLCYLYPGAMKRLGPKLSAELPPGTPVVSHTFALPDWVAERTAVAPDLYRTPVYRYRAPALTRPGS